jgi:periplasmic divalent cation tolerance protein
MTNATLALVSCPPGQAEEIARSVIQNKLGACVTTIAKATSFYTWQNNFHKEEESLLLIKTKKDNWNALEKLILDLHTYDVPEIISLPIATGYSPYLIWLKNNC